MRQPGQEVPSPFGKARGHRGRGNRAMSMHLQRGILAEKWGRSRLDALEHFLHNRPARMDHGRRGDLRPATERTPAMRSRSSLLLAVVALAAAAATAGDPAPPAGLDGVWEITGVIDNGDAVS